MRLGAPLQQSFDTPEEWVAAVQAKGYRAAYCPVGTESGSAERSEYRAAANEADIVIAEVGAWSNPLSRDRATADAAYRKMVTSLALADEMGARCCVNIAGSLGAKWDGPDPRDLTPETFDLIVDMTRRILDEVMPTTTKLALEPMPWMYPDSAESYLQLIEAVDRPGFAVHYDPVNLVNSPQKYFRTGDEIDAFVEQLGPWIVSVHAKDIILRDSLTTHLDECIPGTGGLDYERFLTRLDELDDDLPLMTEHLQTEAEYDLAAANIRGVAGRLNVSL
jgi:sugar phosphate isomerase/epimerase